MATLLPSYPILLLVSISVSIHFECMTIWEFCDLIVGIFVKYIITCVGM
jgi:hypothetical protein